METWKCWASGLFNRTAGHCAVVNPVQLLTCSVLNNSGKLYCLKKCCVVWIYFSVNTRGHRAVHMRNGFDAFSTPSTGLRNGFIAGRRAGCHSDGSCHHQFTCCCISYKGMWQRNVKGKGCRGGELRGSGMDCSSSSPPHSLSRGGNSQQASSEPQNSQLGTTYLDIKTLSNNCYANNNNNMTEDSEIRCSHLQIPPWFECFQY